MTSNYSKDKYVRIPVPLKRQSKKYGLINLVTQHKRFIAWYKLKLGLSDYALLWLCFFKGVLIGLIIEKLIAN